MLACTRTTDRRAVLDSPLHRATPLVTLRVPRAGHEALTPCVSQHLGDSIAIPDQRLTLRTEFQKVAGAALYVRGMNDEWVRWF